MTDEELAAEIMLELWPRGMGRKGSDETGIPHRTFTRIQGGGGIKSQNWARLNAHPEFRRLFAKAKKERAPQIDDDTKEAMVRLARAVGPSNVKDLTFEFESLVMMMGAQGAIDALADVVKMARKVADSVDESESSQKTSR